MSAPQRFGGAAGPHSILGDYYHYVFTEWVDRHDVPTEAAALADFDQGSVRVDYARFLAAGGKVRTQVGVTAEQWWLGEQLLNSEPLVLVANSERFTGEPLARVTRKAVPPSAMLAELVPTLFRIRLNRRDVEDQRARWGPLLTPTFGFGVHDGGNGHALRMIGVDRKGTGVFYRESWPAGSFLEPSAAVAVDGDPGIWQVPLDRLMPVLSLVFLPVAAWAAATGDHSFGTGATTRTPPPQRVRPPDAADRARRFLEHCREHGLLTEQGIADFVLLYERNILFDRDGDGRDTLDHLYEMATTPRAPGFDQGAVLSEALRLLAGR